MTVTSSTHPLLSAQTRRLGFTDGDDDGNAALAEDRQKVKLLGANIGGLYYQASPWGFQFGAAGG